MGEPGATTGLHPQPVTVGPAVRHERAHNFDPLAEKWNASSGEADGATDPAHCDWEVITYI